MCNNDLPQSNYDFCTKAAWPRPSQFWSIVPTMWGANSGCSIAAKNTWLDPSFVCNNDLPQSNYDFCTKAAWPRPSQFWGTVATMWGTNSECSIAAKNTWLDPSFVCNNDLPQSNHDFCTKAAWPRPSQLWSIVPTMWGTNSGCSIAAKNTWLGPSFVCNNDLPQSNYDFCTTAAWPRPSQFWGTVATMWGTNSECRIAAKNTW